MIPHRLASACLLAGCALSTAAQAASTELATAPLVTSSAQDVLPNLMFILDDSGSMAWSHMPDTVENFAVGRYGYVSSQCNGLYYNPNVKYKAPVAADGTKYADANFVDAKRNGFSTSASPTKINLSTSFQPYIVATTDNQTTDALAVPAFYYRYTGSQTTNASRDYANTSGTFYKECNSLINVNDASNPGYGVFTKVIVSDISGPANSDERTNFANWYSFYRTRILLMKTQTGRAFQGIGERYRVGYMSINNNVSPSLLNIGKFAINADGTGQKVDWFTKLYTASASGSTPLRPALSNAGRIYAKKLSTLYGATVTDPVQYSCQKNFTLLSTDGYWNSGAGVQLDGSTAIGQQDDDDPRPYNDGTTSITRRVATITFSGTNSNTLVTSVKVDGNELMSGSIDDNNDPNKVAQRVRDQINACTGSKTGNCSQAGYSAVRAGGVVTITAPASAGPVSSTPVVTKGYGNMGVAVTGFGASTTTIAGPADTLADVAAYYYKTDLRSEALINTDGALGNDVSKNNVVGSGDDDVSWQHMTTYTLGLGARGRMTYDLKYKAGGMSADYDAIVAGSAATSSTCTWQALGTTCNWPTPGSDKPENIDDMWHAAVNGRGLYFSASDSTTLAVSLSAALQSIAAVDSDTSAATVSNPSIKSGDNFIFISTYRSETWTGQLERRTVDVDNANETSVAWKAHELLDVKAPATRSIHTYDPTNASTRLKPFLWASLDATERAWFSTPYISTDAAPPISQFCEIGAVCLSALSQTAASGAKLVEFLRGDRSNEGVAIDTDKFFRLRLGVLGDIVNSETAYVAGPTRDYVDAGYAAFKTAKSGRAKMVYVGANDGMLHAFDFASGEESWAYVPSFVLPKMYRLADKYYGGSHQPLVDATPATGDVKTSGGWKTILVGGLGLGGRGYYALDITDPASPKALWEFADKNMGYSFGKPEITKLKSGKWVVLLSSGYNNNAASGDGKGRLFVLDAETGASVINDANGDPGIPTSAGSTGTPSGMAAIAAWVENNRYDNTALRVYGGDLEGNLWRFDINGDLGPSGHEAHLLAKLEANGKAQPLTARPELGKVKGYPIVFVGTGRYLHATDLTNSEQQTIYGIKDDLVNNASHVNPRGAAGFVQQTLTATTCAASSKFCTTGANIRKVTSTNAVDFDTDKGWYVDLPVSGERANTDPQLALGTLAISTNIPSTAACEPGGSSFTNFLDYRTGGAVPTSEGVVGVALEGIASRAEIVQTSTDPSKPKLYDKVSTSKKVIETTPLPFDPHGTGTRRNSWRQLVID